MAAGKEINLRNLHSQNHGLHWKPETPITEKRKSRNRLVSNLLACEHLRTISYTTFDEGTERNKGGNNRVDIRGIDLKGK
jgi:hypothetical protein